MIKFISKETNRPACLGPLHGAWRTAGVQVIKLITPGRCVPPITALIDAAAAGGSLGTFQEKSRGENFHLYISTSGRCDIGKATFFFYRVRKIDS